jgi:hypothetical protein
MTVFNFNETVAHMNHAHRQAVLGVVVNIKASAFRVNRMAAAVEGGFRNGNDPDVDMLVRDLDELRERAIQLEAAVYVASLAVELLPEDLGLSKVKAWLSGRGDAKSETFVKAVRHEMILARMRQAAADGRLCVHFMERSPR